MMAPLGNCARNPLGSLSAKSRISGSSSKAYGFLGNACWASVVLPDWRGPVSAMTGNERAKDSILEDSILLIMDTRIPEKGQNVNYIYNLSVIAVPLTGCSI